MGSEGAPRGGSGAPRADPGAADPDPADPQDEGGQPRGAPASPAPARGRLPAYLSAALSAALLGGVLLLYLLYPSARYTGDGTLFARVIQDFRSDRGLARDRLFFHPHHLLYCPLGAAFVEALGPAPPEDRHPDILRLTWMSSLLAGLALASFFLLLRRALGSVGWATALTLLLGFSHGFWNWAVAVEVQALNLLLVVLFLLALESRPGGPRRAAMVGLAHGAAVLGHLLNGLLVVPAIARLVADAWSPREGRLPRLARSLAVYVGAAGIVAGVPYLLVAGFLGKTTPASLLAWLRPGFTGHFAVAPWTGFPRLARHLETVVLGPPADASAVAWWTLRLLLAGVVLVALGRLLAGRALPEAASLRRAALWTLLGYVPLWTVWDAGNEEFIAFGLPAAVALLGGALAPGPGPGARARARPLLAGLGLTACLLGAYQLVNEIAPAADPFRNRPWVHAAFIRSHTAPEDVTIISGVGPDELLKFYLPYFAERPRLVVQWEVVRHGDARAATRALRSDVLSRLAGARRVHVTSELFLAETLAALEAETGIGERELDEVLQGLDRVVVARLEDGTLLYRLVPRSQAPAREAPATPDPGATGERAR